MTKSGIINSLKVFEPFLDYYTPFNTPKSRALKVLYLLAFPLHWLTSSVLLVGMLVVILACKPKDFSILDSNPFDLID